MHASLCVTGVLPGLQVSVVPGLGSWDLLIMPTPAVGMARYTQMFTRA